MKSEVHIFLRMFVRDHLLGTCGIALQTDVVGFNCFNGVVNHS